MRNKKGIVSGLLGALVILIIAGSLFVGCNQPAESSSGTVAETLEIKDSSDNVTLTISDFDKTGKSCKVSFTAQIGVMSDAGEVTAKATFNDDFTKLTFSEISPAEAITADDTGLKETADAYDTSTITDVSVVRLSFDLTKVKEKLN